MTDRPILFSASMVRALLAGNKTQTRRLIKPQPDELLEGQIPEQLRIEIGDHLWVREEHFRFGHWEPKGDQKTKTGKQKWHFAQDSDELLFEAPDTYRKGRSHKDPFTPAWHSRLGRFMFRRHSRLTLCVTDVRVERLQDISEEDSIAEGIEAYGGIDPSCSGYLNYANNTEDGYWLPAKASYAALWNHINGDGAWESNPWIVAYSFDLHRCNIDHMEGANG